MALNLGNNSITNVKLGDTQITKIMLGTVQIFSAITGETTTTTTTTTAPSEYITLLTAYPTNPNSITVIGDIYYSGIIQMGFVWSTNHNPQRGVNSEILCTNGNGNFSAILTGLTSGTLYYIRGFVTTPNSTDYSQEAFCLA